jgi:hypothetical protein
MVRTLFIRLVENQNLNSISMNHCRKPLALLFCTLVLSALTIAQDASITEKNTTEKEAITIPSSSVSLCDLNASKTGRNQVTIRWHNSGKLIPEFFRIERSPNKIDYTTLAILRGSDKSEEYSHTDDEPLAGENYYRIGFANEKGEMEFCDPVRIRLNGITGTVTISPNPAKDLLQVQISCAEKGVLTLSIFSQNGILVRQLLLTKQDESLQYPLPVNDLQKGNYILQVKIRNQIETQQFVRQ